MEDFQGSRTKLQLFNNWFEPHNNDWRPLKINWMQVKDKGVQAKGTKLHLGIRLGTNPIDGK